MVKFKADQIKISTVNIILISIFYQLILLLGYSILLDGFKIRDEVLDLSRVDAKISGCRLDGDFILYGDHELLVYVTRRHVNFLC